MQLITAARVAALLLVTLGASLPMTAHTADAPATAAPPTRFGGILTVAKGNTLTIKGADGTDISLTVAKDAWIVKGRPIKASDIKPGDFVATANVNNADGTGTSTELRVFPPGLRIGEGSYPMDAPNTTMTNAQVSGVVDVSDGRKLTVTYGASTEKGTPAGSRTITLPANVQVMQWYRVTLADLKIGERLRGRGTPMGGTGGILADFIFADDAPPPVPAPAPGTH